MHDLNEKLRLEAILRPKLRTYHADVIQDFQRSYANDGSIIVMSDFDNQLSDILVDHYENVSTVFDNGMTQKLPADIAVTEDEKDLIAESLLAWVFLQGPKQARLINATTQGNVLDAIRTANSDQIVRDLTGREAQRTAAAIASRQLERDLLGREHGILTTETQTIAETARATEAEVLAGQTPSIRGGEFRGSAINKEWVSVGDNLVRPSHISADGQIVPMNEAFIVGGESLQWPGDPTLGASVGNIANCRCSADYNTAELFERRRLVSGNV